MSNNFIDEVRHIIISNLTNENFGVRELAASLNLSTSQTLRKVKTVTGKSVNQYIRELRLEKAAKLLKETDFTASEIAFQVGFNSASYFNKTFSKYFGISPGEYKTQNISLNELTTQKNRFRFRNLSLTKKIISAITLGLLIVLGYFLINNFTSKNNQLSNSIAVLPFKDFSPVDNQWFSDGVSDNILHSFSQMKNLSVISFTSSSTYRNSDKKIPEIAKELGVSYILEGSVTLLEDKIKIIIQLIDAKDKHVWSKEYYETFDDIISIQNNIAQQVMNQLQVTLSPQEKIALTKYPTENMEAYSLFLKGRLINDSRGNADLWNNIELNKQAIALDPNFAEAYAEIALSYWKLGKVDLDTFMAIDGMDLAHKYADSALNINQNTYRALAVKAELYEHVEWDKSNAYYKKALAVNPN
ncbi:MAG TPA: helix-turn-helix domain-containing protein, partial [Flavobacteriaceae bacterium]|nr:helix-turn-helix domain-containing protein [Flavobacteriaceae bacterium]